MSEARDQILNLLYSYGELVDAGDFAAVGKLLAHAEVTSEANGLSVRGSDQVTRLYERTTRLYPETGTPRTRHLITNPIVEVDEERGSATCHSCYTVLQQTDSMPLQPIIAGRYRSAFECAGDRWRFASHEFFVDLVGDLSQHLLTDLDAVGAEPR